MSDMIEEIKEDVRLDQIIGFVKKYANHLIGGFLAAALLLAVYSYWSYRTEQKILESASLYEQALVAIDAKDPARASELLTRLRSMGQGGYPIFAGFKLATLTTTTPDERHKIYRALIEDAHVEAKFRELAAVLNALDLLDGGSFEEIKKDLAPVAASASPWRASANEILALVALAEGHKDQATETLKLLAQDAQAPQGVRSRALLLLEHAGVDVSALILE